VGPAMRSEEDGLGSDQTANRVEEQGGSKKIANGTRKAEYPTECKKTIQGRGESFKIVPQKRRRRVVNSKGFWKFQIRGSQVSQQVWRKVGNTRGELQ